MEVEEGGKKMNFCGRFSLETNCLVQLWGGTGDSADPQCAEASLGISHRSSFVEYFYHQETLCFDSSDICLKG